MKINSIRLLSSITFIAAVGSTAVAHAEPETKYKTITATLSLNIDSRDDKFSSTPYSDSQWHGMVLSRNSVPAKGKLTFQVDGLPEMKMKEFSPKDSSSAVKIDVIDSASGLNLVAHTQMLPDVKMSFSAPSGCYEYDQKAHDQMVLSETQALSTQLPSIISSVLADAEIAEHVRLKSDTKPTVVSIENSRGSHDECLKFGKDAEHTVMSHQPSSVRVVLQMTVVDQPEQADLSNVSLEMKKPEYIKGGF